MAILNELGIHQVSARTLGLGTLGAILLFSIVHVVYHRFFNPCARFPGPAIASISKLWKVLSLLSGEGEKTLMELHKKYGPIVRIAPYELSVCDASEIKNIYRSFPKTDEFSMFRAPWARYPGHMENTDTKLAVQRKRIVGDTYSLSKVLTLEPGVDLCLLKFEECFQRVAQAGQTANIKLWSHLFAFDVIGRMFFSENFGFLECGGDQGQLLKAIETATRVGLTVVNFHKFLRPVVVGLACLLPHVAIRIIGIVKPIGSLERRVDVALNKLCQSSANRQDFLSRWFQIYEDKGAVLDFGMPEIKQEAWTALFAGSDTTSVALSATFYYMLKNREWYDKLVAEIQQADRDGLLTRPCITFKEGMALRYLGACIKEATRLHPSGSITFPRRVTEGGCTIAEQYIPEGAEIGCNPYVVHRDPKVFGEDAHLYNPARWLGPRAAEMERHILLFGYGPRICLGRNIALCQLYKFVPQLLRNFDVKLVDPNLDWSYTPYRATKLDVTVSRRVC